jgi:hypothetical protein
MSTEVVVYSSAETKRQTWLRSIRNIFGVISIISLLLLSFTYRYSVLSNQPLVLENPTPSKIVIPGLDLSANIVPISIDDTGRLALPPSDSVGWYRYSGTIQTNNRPYNLILLGHYDSEIGAAVFYPLNQIETGAHIHLLDSDNRAHHYLVTHGNVYSVTEFPLEELFSSTTSPQLVLITCEGIFDTDKQDYSHRRVIYATPAQTNPQSNELYTTLDYTK